MSMSTGGVSRQPANKLSAKAAATDKPKPDVIDVDGVDTDAVDATDEVETDTGKAATKTVVKSVTKAAAPPKVVKTAKTPAKSATKVGGARPGGKPPAGRGPTKSGGGKGRRPVPAVKVSQGRNWGPILMFGGACLVAILIIGFGAYALINRPDPSKWRARADAIPGIHDYLKSNPDWFVVPAAGNHKTGVLTYPTSPPVGGTHAPYWQNCMGDVYTAQVPKEQATHSMEHGAVWVAYRPDLPKDQVDKLASKVRDKSFMLMSPYPGLDTAISLQAWGFQLKVDNASDGRIDDFITNLRQNTSQEPQAGCSGGITDTSPTPLNLTPPPTTDPAAAAGLGG
jgi:hypothetical protein